jgi:hypothetical protein
LLTMQLFITHGEMAELVEGARLESEYMRQLVSRVRIPLSPPQVI